MGFFGLELLHEKEVWIVSEALIRVSKFFKLLNF